MILSSISPQFHPPNRFVCKAATATPTTATTTSFRCNNRNTYTAGNFRQMSSSSSDTNTCYVSNNNDQEDKDVVMVSSASAISAVIRKASTSPVEFIQRIDTNGKNKGVLLPSSDFQRLCVEQLDLFRRIIDPDARLSVYVRPAGSYVMDQLELRRVSSYPGRNSADFIIVVCNFSVPTGFRAAEAALLKRQAEFIPECRALVFPMVKPPFVVGFLVAELPNLELREEKNDVKQGQSPEESYALCTSASESYEITSFDDKPLELDKFSAEQMASAISISLSVATAYVMDQRALLLQQSTWQNNVRMTDLVEQIRDPLSTIRTLSNRLSAYLKRSEVSYDVVEDIVVQGDRIRESLQQLQDAVHLTKANIAWYNEENLKKLDGSVRPQPHLSDFFSKDTSKFSKDTSKTETDAQESSEPCSLTSTFKDLQMPMPPLALAPLQHQNTRPCNVSDMLSELVGAIEPLARLQQRTVQLCELSQSLEVVVEEYALRQALSNLIEGALHRTTVGGKVEIVSMAAPAGGALIIVDDDGPDMQYMTQMHSLPPFGADLLTSGMVEDQMTWDFATGLAVARDILKDHGCVLRVISPRRPETSVGAGGTRLEIWLPSSSSSCEDLEV